MNLDEMREQIRSVCMGLARSISMGAAANGEGLVNFSYLIDENIFDRIPLDFTDDRDYPGKTVRTESAYHDWGPGNHTQMVVAVRAISNGPRYLEQVKEYGLGLALSEELSTAIAALPIAGKEQT